MITYEQAFFRNLNKKINEAEDPIGLPEVDGDVPGDDAFPGDDATATADSEIDSFADASGKEKEIVDAVVQKCREYAERVSQMSKELSQISEFVRGEDVLQFVAVQFAPVQKALSDISVALREQVPDVVTKQLSAEIKNRAKEVKGA